MKQSINEEIAISPYTLDLQKQGLKVKAIKQPGIYVRKFGKHSKPLYSAPLNDDEGEASTQPT